MRIDVENLFFSYPDKPVLRGVDLHVAQGEIACLVGPNGSGKSTLIKCMDALLRPQSGKIFFDGIDSRTLHRLDVAKRLGYVPQSTHHSFSTSVFDTVLMGRRPYGSWHTSDEDIQVVIGILIRMELESVALQDFNRLSGGQQQRVLIARALAQEPNSLLLDEPTSSLDIANQLEVMDIIHDLVARQRISVIMVVHDLNLASRYADNVILLSHGRVHAEGPPESVFTQRNIADVYGIESSIRKNNGSLFVQPIRRLGATAPSEKNDGY